MMGPTHLAIGVGGVMLLNRFVPLWDDSQGLMLTMGAAVVSSLHANFIVNEGGARACEVLELIDLLRARCRAYHGFDLQPEIRIAGADLAGLEGVNHV